MTTRQPEFTSPYAAFPYALMSPPWNLKAHTVALYARLWDGFKHFGHQPRGYSPDREHLADVLGTNLRSIDRWVAELKSVNLITTEQRGKDRAARFYVRHFERDTVDPQIAPTSVEEENVPTEGGVLPESGEIKQFSNWPDASRWLEDNFPNALPNERFPTVKGFEERKHTIGGYTLVW